MIITCDKCNTRFSLDDALVKATGTKVRCKQCEHVFDVYPSGKPAFDDKVDVEISGLEMENKSLSAEKGGDVPGHKPGGIDFDFEFEESDQESQDADKGLELEDGELQFELEMESGGQTRDKGLQMELDTGDEDLKLELESSGREPEDALTPKADDEEEEFELDLDLEPVEFKGSEPEKGAFEEEIDISEIEKMLESEEEGPEPAGGDEDTELDLELDLEDEEAMESASSLEEDTAEEEGFDINLSLEGEPETDFAPTEPVDSKNRPVQFPKKKDAEVEPEEPLVMADKERPAVQPPSFDIGTLAEPEVAQDAEEEEEAPYSIGSYQPETHRGSRLPVFLLVILLLAGAGYGAFWLMQNKGIKIPVISQLFTTSAADKTGNLNISTTEVASRFVTTAKQGRLFVITGKARNDYAEARSAIKITAKLYAPGKVLVATQSVFCGNFLSNLELESLDIETIQKILQNPSGDNYSGDRVEPGKEIPFMVVFSSLPDNLDEFTVEVEGSSPVKP